MLKNLYKKRYAQISIKMFILFYFHERKKNVMEMKLSAKNVTENLIGLL